MNLCVYPLRPESKGSVSIRSRNANELPEIQSGYGTAQDDRSKMIDIVRLTRQFVNSSALAAFKPEETRPGPDFRATSRSSMRICRWATRTFTPAAAVAWAGMINCVDPRLRVRGVDGLRVVDTSIFPVMPSGNTNGPAMVLGWRAADLILAER